MIGELIGGRYRLLSQIGEGGHGVVYRAEQLGMSRPVALKLMQRQRFEAGQLERFTREAELVQRLSHPNTVRLLDHGIHDDELPYMVFELLEGRSLQQILAGDGPLPPRRVAHIAAQLLKALIEAHELGIIHRDIKPANVFISPIAGDPDFTKLLDFGIAKSLATNLKALTAAGEILGTPSYMSPEHIEARPVGPPSDLYSLGLVMSEMLSGRRVYGGSAIDVCLQQVSHQPAPLPPEATASALGPVITRAASKRMEARFTSASEMLTALEAAISGPALTAVLVQSPNASSAPVSFTSSNPSLPAFSSPVPSTPKRSYVLHLVLGCVALALVAAIFVALHVLLRASKPPMPAPAAASAPRETTIHPIE